MLHSVRPDDDPDNVADVTTPLQRIWRKETTHNASKTDDDVGQFSIVSYNILADCHTPENFFPYCPRDYFRDVQRLPQLLRELDHHAPNILCMQEVGREFYKDHLEPALRERGYAGSYHGNYYEGFPCGLANFYKKSRFELIEDKKVDLAQVFEQETVKRNVKEFETKPMESRALLFSRLRCCQSNKTLCVANVHLLFLLYKSLDVTTLEAALAIRFITDQAGDGPYILCGDFNQEPHMPGYQILNDGQISEENKTVLRGFPWNRESITSESEKMYVIDIMPELFAHEAKNLKSAYKTIMGHEVPFSNHEDMNGTMKFPAVIEADSSDKSPEHEAPSEQKQKSHRIYRTKPENYGEEVFIGALDYFWYDCERLKCTGVLEMIDESKIEQFHSAPNVVFPSDHLLMKAEFRFLS